MESSSAYPKTLYFFSADNSCSEKKLTFLLFIIVIKEKQHTVVTQACFKSINFFCSRMYLHFARSQLWPVLPLELQSRPCVQHHRTYALDHILYFYVILLILWCYGPQMRKHRSRHLYHAFISYVTGYSMKWTDDIIGTNYHNDIIIMDLWHLGTCILIDALASSYPY